MIAYVDSSILLRRLLKQPRPLAEWPLLRNPVSSRLTELECIRTLDRLRVAGEYSEIELASLRSSLARLLTPFEIVELRRAVLERAAQPYPSPLGTLDAIHLGSALLARERVGAHLVLATHDAAFALAGRTHGFRVVGV